MKVKKDLKKIFLIIGIVAVGIFLLFSVISTTINIVSNITIIGLNSSIFSNIWSIFKTILIYGFMCFFLIYELVKKSNKRDKVINIIVFVVFCILALSSFIDIFKVIHTLTKYGHYYNGIRIVSCIISILSSFLKIGLFVLFGINTMGLALNKNKATKVLTIIILSLIVLVFVNSLITTILNLIIASNIRNVLSTLSSSIASFALAIFQASLAYIIYNKIKNYKEPDKIEEA